MCGGCGGGGASGGASGGRRWGEVLRFCFLQVFQGLEGWGLLPRGAEDQWTTCCRRGARAPNAPSSRSPAPSRRLLESVF
jgi:hypothetical protein